MSKELFCKCDRCRGMLAYHIEQMIKEEHLINSSKGEQMSDFAKDTNVPANDCISRQAAIDALMTILDKPNHAEFLYTDEICKVLNELPSAQPERKKGKWEDKEVFNETDDDHIVDEWQSARCSACGLYHTTPYSYYFYHYKYCPDCGADMREKEKTDVI